MESGELDAVSRSDATLLHLTMHPFQLMSEDYDNNMCARDIRIVINAYVLRELDRAARIASIRLNAFFLNTYCAFCFRQLCGC